MMSGRGVNTVTVNGEVKSILDLHPVVLSQQWSLLVHENSSLYEANKKATSGWRGLILRLLGVKLPQKTGFVISDSTEVRGGLK